MSVQPERIVIRHGTTSEAPLDPGAGASRVTHIVGQASLRGAADLKNRLEELAAEVMGWPSGHVRIEDDRFVVDETDLAWVRPEAGLIGLARLPAGISSDDFARRLLAAPYRTFLLPGSAYGQPDHIRLGVGGGKSVDLEKGLRRVAQLLETW